MAMDSKLSSSNVEGGLGECSQVTTANMKMMTMTMRREMKSEMGKNDANWKGGYETEGRRFSKVLCRSKLLVLPEPIRPGGVGGKWRK